MASETDYSEPSSVIERLLSSRNRDLAMFVPFVLALTNNSSSPNPIQDSSNPGQETQENLQALIGSSNRIILINPFTQGMVVIEGSSSSPSSLESLLRDFFSKDGQPPTSKASMEAMPSVEINESGLQCAICLEEWEVGVLAKEMPCNHRFHGECIEKWLRIHGSCPVCRYKVRRTKEVGEDGKVEEKVGGRGRR